MDTRRVASANSLEHAINIGWRILVEPTLEYRGRVGVQALAVPALTKQTAYAAHSFKTGRRGLRLKPGLQRMIR